MSGLGAAIALIPTWAWAIPGAGDMTSVSSPSGREIAGLYQMLAIICLVIFAIVSSFMLVAILRYRRRSEDEMPEQVHGNMRIEMGLLIAATLLQVFIGYKTIGVMWYVEKMPTQEKMFTVEAIAKKWDWQFRYPDEGGLVSEDLVVPAHKNIKLEVTSVDVIHSIFIPELGVKMDAVPGRFNYWWFKADGPINQVTSTDNARKLDVKERTLDTTRNRGMVNQVLNLLNLTDIGEQPKKTSGLEKRVRYLAQGRKVEFTKLNEPVSPYAKYDAVEYRGMCTELCGTGHYNMYFRVVAMTPSSYKQWVSDMKSGANKGPVNGAAVYEKKCATCHKADGNGAAGMYPPLVGTKWTSIDSVESKNSHIKVVLQGLKGKIKVKGVEYNGQMSPFHRELNDEEVAAVVNHERTSWGNKGGTVTADMVKDMRKALGFPARAAGGVPPMDESDLMQRGKNIYEACSTCHGDDGKGNARLAGTPGVLGTPQNIVNVLLGGTRPANTKGPFKPTHPPMGSNMSDAEMASVVTYIRKSFGNKASSVQPAEVKRLREQWTKANQ